MQWTPDITARLDQAAAEVRAKAERAGLTLESADIGFLLALIVRWATEHEDEFDSPERWVAEIHWLAMVLATAGGQQEWVTILRGLYDAWSYGGPPEI